jgi:glutathione S-transferase
MLIIGSHVSPYVRKVLVALAIKGVAHEVDPITPFYGNDEFSRLSPLRRIPVLIDGDLVLNDSTVICEYVEETWPDPPLLPRAPADRAKARWLEEFADSRLGDLCIWRLFFATVVRPRVFKQEPDLEDLTRVTDVELPAALDWIEAQAPAEGFLFGSVCAGEIGLACFFRNASIAGWEIDPARWPRTAAWVARVQAIPEFAATMPMETAILTTPNAERRDALTAAGARLSEVTYGEPVPRASIMLR